jgi:hypothetical protein
VAQLILAGDKGIHNTPTEDGFLNWRGKNILRVRIRSIIHGKDAHWRRRDFWYALSEAVWTAGWEGNNIISQGCRESYIFRHFDPALPKRPRIMPGWWEPITDMTNQASACPMLGGLVPLPPWRPDKRKTIQQGIADVVAAQSRRAAAGPEAKSNSR